MRGKKKTFCAALLASVMAAALFGAKTTAAEAAPSVAAKADGGHTVTFTYTNDNAKSVYIGGDFNGYCVNDPAWKLTKNQNGDWELSKDMESGVWQYSLVVDGVWTEDPQNDAFSADGQSNKLVVPGAVQSPVVDGTSVTFNYPASLVPADAAKVVVKGAFNNWAEHEMCLSADGTHYTCTVNGLAADTYEYGVCIYTMDQQRQHLCSSFCGDYYNMHASCHGGNSVFTIQQPAVQSPPVNNTVNTGSTPVYTPPVNTVPVYTPPVNTTPVYTTPVYYPPATTSGGCHSGWYGTTSHHGSHHH